MPRGSCTPMVHAVPSGCGPMIRTSPPRFTRPWRAPMFLHARGGAIGGVLLADAAEVDFHAGARQAHLRAGPLDAVPAHERQQRLDVLGPRQPRRLEVPGASEHAAREVECTAAPRVQLPGEVEQGRRLVVDLHGRAAGRAIDRRRHAVVAIARVLGLDPPHLVDGGLRPAARGGLVRREHAHFAARRHRAELERKHGEGHGRMLPVGTAA